MASSASPAQASTQLKSAAAAAAQTDATASPHSSTHPLAHLLRPPQVLLLYRRILKAAARFPSIKRDAVVADIKREFRDHAALADPAAVRHELGVALRSLEQLEAYTGMHGSSADLVVSLKGSCE